MLRVARFYGTIFHSATTAKYLVQFCEAKASKPDDGTLALLPKPAAKRQKVVAQPAADRVCFKCGACEKDVLISEPQVLIGSKVLIIVPPNHYPTSWT